MAGIHRKSTVQNLVQARHLVFHLQELAGDLCLPDPLNCLDGGVGPKQSLQGEQLVEDATQRENVGRRRELLIRVGLFRRQVLHVAWHRVRHGAMGQGRRRAGEGKAPQLNLAILLHEYGGWAQPQVEHGICTRSGSWSSVNGLQAVADLGGKVEEDVGGDGGLLFPTPCHHALEVNTVDPLLHHKTLVVDLQPVQGLHEVGVSDAQEIFDPGLY